MQTIRSLAKGIMYIHGNFRKYGSVLEYDEKQSTQSEYAEISGYWIQFGSKIVESQYFKEGCCSGCLQCAMFNFDNVDLQCKEVPLQSNLFKDWCLSKCGKIQRRFHFRVNDSILFRVSIPRNWPQNPNGDFCLSIGTGRIGMTSSNIPFYALEALFSRKSMFKNQNFETFKLNIVLNWFCLFLENAHNVKNQNQTEK